MCISAQLRRTAEALSNEGHEEVHGKHAKVRFGSLGGQERENKGLVDTKVGIIVSVSISGPPTCHDMKLPFPWHHPRGSVWK